MAEWWESAPVVDAATEGDWWADAPMADAQQQSPAIADYIAQTGAGTQSGIAQMLGYPVDAVASGMSGIGELTGLWGPLENPVGGSASIDAALSPFREGIAEPTTDGLRAARRFGEEIGAGAITAPVAAAAMPARMGAAAGAELISSLGAGAGAGAAEYVAPDSAAAEIAGLLLGGATAGMGASRALGLGGTDDVVRGGIADQRQRASDAYDMVRADDRLLSRSSVNDLVGDIDADMLAQRMNPRLQPSSDAILDAVVRESRGPMRIEDMEDLRRITQQNVPSTATPADRRLVGRMTDEITDYLSGLGDPVADALVEGRNAHRRASAAQVVSDASTKAARRAASTGSGGNEINAMRQNLRGIIDNPRKARSFTTAEREMMDQVVRGTTGQNAMRRLSRFAPSSGGLSAMLGVGGAMANPAIALPIMGITELAKSGGERSTRRVIDALMQSIAPDRVLSAGEYGADPILRLLLGARATREE